MKTLNIGTWNIKNSYFDTGLNDLKVTAIIDLLESEYLNILGLQEVNPLLASKLEEKLAERCNGYKITTSYKKSINPINNLRVEYNMIISNIPFYKDKKMKLVSDTKTGNKRNIKPRNLTSQTFIAGNDEIVFNNTCLESNNMALNLLQCKQVYWKMLGDIQDDINVQSILVGNLNVFRDSVLMEDEYLNYFDNLGLKVIDNPNRTYKFHSLNQPIDYIIVPKEYEVISVNCPDYYTKKVSTHNPVFTKVKVK